MFGPARRPSKRLRTPLLAAAALGAAALLSPTTSLGATVGQFDVDLPSTCVVEGTTVSPPISVEIAVHLEVTDSQHAAPITGDELFVSGLAKVTLDAADVEAIKADPRATGAQYMSGNGDVRVTGTDLARVDFVYGGSSIFAPGPAYAQANLQSVGAISALGGSTMDFSLNAIRLYLTRPAGVWGPATSVFWTCKPSGDSSVGSLAVGGAPPTVSGLSQTTGSSAGGDRLTVVGSFQDDVQKVDFGGVPATFEKLDDRQIAVTVPPLPTGTDPTGVRVRVTTAAGESQEPVLFDYVDPADSTQVLGAFTSQCVSSSQDYRGEPFAVTTRVRVKTDASAGSDLRVVTSASLELAAPAVKSLFALTGLRVENATLSAGPLSLGVSGTSQNSIVLGGADGATGPSLNRALGVPVTFGTPATGFGPSTSAGQIDPGTSGVTFTGAPFTFRSYVIARVDAPDDISVIPGFATYSCTPTGDATVGSLKVGGGPAPVSTPVSFGVAGTATLKNLVKGSLPLTGSLSGEFDPAGAFTGNLSLAQGTAKLTALGILPVVAKVALVQTAPLTGTQSGSSFSGTAKVRVKVPSASVFGVQLGGGANCQATQVSTIPLKSTGSFTPAAGGTLTGTFSISNLSGCGALNGIVSSLTAGSGNSLALALAPAPKS